MSDFVDFIKRNRAAALLIILILVSVVSISLSTGGGLIRPKQAGFTVLSVFQKGASGIGSFFSNTVNSINELRELRTEYELLKDRLAEFEEIERDIDELRNENAGLRKQLGFSATSPFRNIPAEVIAKDPGNSFNSIVINKGRSEGIERNMPVIGLAGGYHGLVGKVADVGEFASIVVPIYDSSSYVSARLQESRYEGLISGSGYSDSVLKMDYVKKIARANIQYGDLVITSGMRSIYPKGIYIGRVTAIEGKEWDTSLHLEIEPVVDFSRLEYVFVLVKEKAE
jgi:rod shape-determining protein MreC